MSLDVLPMSDRVYAVLRERILHGQLGHGERLHQEALAEELGVSRTPLREALRRLAADGLVELLPNRGARVAATDTDDMRCAYEARLVIEPAAAALAARRADRSEAVAELREATAALRAASGKAGVQEAFAANRTFHVALVRASGNPHLLRFVEALWVGRVGLPIYERQRALSDFLAADADGHEAIADAIAAGEADRAEELTREHIAGAMEFLLEAVG